MRITNIYLVEHLLKIDGFRCNLYFDNTNLIFYYFPPNFKLINCSDTMAIIYSGDYSLPIWWQNVSDFSKNSRTVFFISSGFVSNIEWIFFSSMISIYINLKCINSYFIPLCDIMIIDILTFNFWSSCCNIL